MNIILSYKMAALHEAARFIWENNPSVLNWPSAPKSVFDVMADIRSMMTKGAISNAKVLLDEKATGAIIEHEWSSFNGTGGYYAVYELINQDENEINIGVDILVDPGVNHPNPGYVNEIVEVVDKDIEPV